MTDSISPSHEISDALRGLSGKPYFDALTKHLCEDHGADIAYVGLLQENRSVMKTVSLFWDGEHKQPATYPIDDTPCQETVSRDFCLYQRMVQASFPADQFLVDEKLEAYVGFPLMDDKGTVIGALVAESRTPLEDDALFNIVRAHQVRTQIELAHRVDLDAVRDTLSQALVLNYSKSMFMANISHELKNPLSAIIGYASLIRDRQVDENQLRDYASEICASGENLLTLINDIMSLAMLEISDDTALSEQFDLTDMARTGKRMIQHQAAQKHLKVVAATRTDPLFVKGDPGHTKKSLMNLLTNAVKYTSLGCIEIEVAEMEDGSARLTVSDTGIGMSADTLAQICEPLTDFKHAYDMHQEGTGLGIPTTMLLMERQGARLDIESEPGKGTRAHLVFPPELVVEDSGDFI
ncbi:MAG: HAMP domain-containing histidine kinase [Alphaproteobacteria bacterium]|nr:HAMP domain-containing histidine kinase [Alphaproteobacteria bacterium]